MEILDILHDLDTYRSMEKKKKKKSNVNWYTPIWRDEASTKDGLCDYVLFFGGDIKKEIHLWSKDDDFKALLYQQGELRGTMLDFYLQFML
jgi:hypothetical protein